MQYKQIVFDVDGTLMKILIPQLCWGEWSKQKRAG